MKRVLTGFCVLALLLSLAALAESDSWALANLDAKVLAKPQAGAQVLTQAPAGSELEYLGKTEYDAQGGMWYNVSWKSVTGWVSAKEVTLKFATLY